MPFSSSLLRGMRGADDKGSDRPIPVASPATIPQLILASRAADPRMSSTGGPGPQGFAVQDAGPRVTAEDIGKPWGRKSGRKLQRRWTGFGLIAGVLRGMCRSRLLLRRLPVRRPLTGCRQGGCGIASFNCRLRTLHAAVPVAISQRHIPAARRADWEHFPCRRLPPEGFIRERNCGVQRSAGYSAAREEL